VDGRPAAKATITCRAESRAHLTDREENLRRLEDVEFARNRGCYNGAGGQNRTGYARLFRAALYQ
jgi:hypothetical protein